MAQQVASLFATMRLDDQNFRRGLADAQDNLRSADTRLSTFATNAREVGGALTMGVTLPVLGAGAAAGTMAVQFDESMTNVRSITGQTREETEALRDEILRVGMNSRAGPQAAAEAFYQIVSGVQDADAQMAIFNASIATAEAGNADLTATTAGMISVMNAYGLEAAEAGRVSDILTRTVGMGVGDMNQFVGALAPASGLAYDLGIGFDELAASTAYLTSTGASASEATTQLTGVMSAFLKPNADMQAALDGMGFATGAAAIEALGLQGAVQGLYGELGSTDAVAQALGTQEALGGALGLNNERAATFVDTFVGGIDGATEAARAIQLESAAAQFDLLMAAVSGAGITIGTVLLPPLVAGAQVLTPLIARVAEANPELIQMGVAAAAGAAAIGPLTFAVGALLSPVGLAIGVVGVLGAAYVTNFGGMRDFVDGEVRPRLMAFFDFLAGVWDQVSPALSSMYGWFVDTGLPGVIGFVTDVALPAAREYFDFVAGVWTLVGVGLQAFSGWFVSTGLPGAIGFVTDVALPAAREYFDFVAGVWTLVGVGLQAFSGWFVDTGLPGAMSFLTETALPAVEGFFGGIVNFIQPAIDKINDLTTAINNIPSPQNVATGFNATADIGTGLRTGQFGFGDVRNAVMAEFRGAPGRASGGPVQAGKPYMVGERGPEPFIPNQDGVILPNGAMGGATININMTVTEGSARQAGANFAEGFESAWRGRQ